MAASTQLTQSTHEDGTKEFSSSSSNNSSGQSNDARDAYVVRGAYDAHDNYDAYDPGPGCRPCCSTPHGARRTLVTAMFTTIASALTIATITSCHYLTPNFKYCYDASFTRPLKQDKDYCWEFGIYNEDHPFHGEDDDRFFGLEFHDDTITARLEINLGLFQYEEKREGGGLLSRLLPFPGWFESHDETHLKGYYSVCRQYKFYGAEEGFWKEVWDRFGSAYVWACIFSIMGLVLGAITCSVGWSACCVAYRKEVFRWMVVLCTCGAICEWMTLLFFASDVCSGSGENGGCEIREGGVNAIVSGSFFLISAILWYWVGRTEYKKNQMPIQCCCCPQFQEEYSGGVTEVELRRTIFPDGKVVMQKTTISSGGFKRIVRTTCLPDEYVGIERGDRAIASKDVAFASSEDEGIPLLSYSPETAVAKTLVSGTMDNEIFGGCTIDKTPNS